MLISSSRDCLCISAGKWGQPENICQFSKNTSATVRLWWSRSCLGIPRNLCEKGPWNFRWVQMLWICKLVTACMPFMWLYMHAHICTLYKCSFYSDLLAESCLQVLCNLLILFDIFCTTAGFEERKWFVRQMLFGSVHSFLHIACKMFYVHLVWTNIYYIIIWHLKIVMPWSWIGY